MSTPSVLIGLYNPKSPTNVGAVMRAAGCFGASEVRFNGQRFARAAKFHTDTKNVTQRIPLQQQDNLLDNLADGVKVVCVELVEGATALPQFTHPENALYVFGPEDGSLPQEIVDRADEVVFIPTVGCLNLAATVNVLLYDRHAKRATHTDYAALIQQSRDTNNRLIKKAR
ncbi:RNA methyltransferase [Bowmanella sp. JS7-9]|uniref:RNA methyltransferase n=1 Tax=Pseudobowmanella zhangzhouensis TaxID=1537679 RepID=A0ABW1XNK6_9ALTE|nr:RNA methyltransferase [Bowmanella sp. JS7-9]TBX23182.1 23S rRNA methyltransferase [Bowmanella sp. JS7-9]